MARPEEAELNDEAGPSPRHPPVQGRPPPPPDDEDAQSKPWKRRRLWMRSEIGAESPFWSPKGGLVMLEDLPLSAELRAALERWATAAWESDHAGLRSEGLRLLDQARTALGPRFQIMWDDE